MPLRLIPLAIDVGQQKARGLASRVIGNELAQIFDRFFLAPHGSQTNGTQGGQFLHLRIHPACRVVGHESLFHATLGAQCIGQPGQCVSVPRLCSQHLAVGSLGCGDVAAGQLHMGQHEPRGMQRFVQLERTLERARRLLGRSAQHQRLAVSRQRAGVLRVTLGHAGKHLHGLLDVVLRHAQARQAEQCIGVVGIDLDCRLEVFLGGRELFPCFGNLAQPDMRWRHIRLKQERLAIVARRGVHIAFIGGHAGRAHVQAGVALVLCNRPFEQITTLAEPPVIGTQHTQLGEDVYILGVLLQLLAQVGFALGGLFWGCRWQTGFGHGGCSV